jgi:hypothetical protein
MSLIYSMLMSVGGYVEISQTFPSFGRMEIGERPVSPASPKNISPRLSIFSVRNDYRMNESKG